MKKLSALLCLVAFAATMTACGTPNSLLVKASDRAANMTIGPEYEDYVNKDESLDETDREIRLRNLQAWRDAIEEAKNKTDGDN